MALSPTTRATVSATSDTVTTGSFTPSADSLLVAMVTFQNGFADDTAATCTMTGTGGLSWTSRANALSTTPFEMRAQIFTAPVGSSPASQTATATITDGSSDNVALALVDFTGYNTGTPTGVTLGAITGSRSGAYSPALSGTSASDSYVVAIGIIADGSGTSDATVGASWNSVYSVFLGFFAAILAEHRSGALSTADWAAFNATFATAAAAVEIKAAGGGGGGVVRTTGKGLTQSILLNPRGLVRIAPQAGLMMRGGLAVPRRLAA